MTERIKTVYLMSDHEECVSKIEFEELQKKLEVLLKFTKYCVNDSCCIACATCKACEAYDILNQIGELDA